MLRLNIKKITIQVDSDNTVIVQLHFLVRILLYFDNMVYII